MENLVGKTILVGKEPQTGKLLLSVKVDGKMKSQSLDMNVPQSVSRCFPEKGVAHCKIEVKDPDTFIIYNAKEPNKTFVDAQEILQKTIHRNNKVELGADHFSLDVDKVLTSAIQLVRPLAEPGGTIVPGMTPTPTPTTKPAPTPVAGPTQGPKPQQPQTPSYSLAHLKPIWEDYEKEMKSINKQHDKISKVKQTVQRCVMIGLPAIAGSLQLVDDNSWGMKLAITLGALVVSIILSFIIPGFIKDPSEERRKLLENDFNKRYVCPNPECHMPFGKTPYDMLSHRMACGNCRCKYINNLTIEKV